MDLCKIQEIQANKKQVRKETYMAIYKQFSRKIMKAVENNFTQVFLEIPVFVVGYPIFDRDKAAVYIKRQLEHSKLDVMRINDYELYVSFVKKKKKKKKQPTGSAQPEAPDEDEFPTLMNLKKAANNLRNK